MSFNETNLVWLDLEMTGLEPADDHVLEVATIVTDSDLNILSEGPVIAIHQPDEILDNMDEWCINQHGKSGLTERCRKSTVDAAQASKITIDFLKDYVPAGVSPMCGNSICQDRRFMHIHMRELEDFFHYRNLDVSTVKELARRWRPDIIQSIQKKGVHLALEDIRESIQELQLYRQHFFNMKA
ncbi:oligoribonuclease [Flocculibacter collagenilyticus]|uniref:oligoribonuclease n=1 Tax=Flocculibacter collagenilyticus TaxID=2744479 RepID=UPI0018F5B1E0|nr:oligoribonuclease [Flocculibacter collagenilyticus]